MEEMLMQLLGGSAPQDPMGAGPVGAAQAAPQEAVAMQAQYPSTDPSVVGSILSQLMGMRMQDMAALQSDQDVVLMQLMQAMGLVPGMPSPDEGFAEGGPVQPGPIL